MELYTYLWSLGILNTCKIVGVRLSAKVNFMSSILFRCWFERWWLAYSLKMKILLALFRSSMGILVSSDLGKGSQTGSVILVVYMKHLMTSVVLISLNTHSVYYIIQVKCWGWFSPIWSRLNSEMELALGFCLLITISITVSLIRWSFVIP